MAPADGRRQRYGDPAIRGRAHGDQHVGWESLEALRQYIYKSAHVELLRDRKEWFEPLEGPILALWWVPAGQIPTVAEALDRLEHLKVRGPTRKAFTFRTPFAPPDVAGELPGPDAEFCEWAT